MPVPDILGCAHCGYSRPTRVYDNLTSAGDKFQIVCPLCGVGTKTCKSIVEAEIIWNKRYKGEV